MRLQKTLQLIDETIETPTDKEDFLSELGGLEIDCPNGDEITISDAIKRDSTTTYNSLIEIHETLMSNLTEPYVGRKYYDDRGPNPMDVNDQSL